jgi:polyhydroxybutyrate depolymerase
MALFTMRAIGRAEDYKSITLEHQGRVRTALVHLPPKFDPRKSRPIVLVFHGGGGNAAGMDLITEWNQKGDQENLIVVYPQGTGRSLFGEVKGTWNAGACCNPARAEKVDDVGFIDALLDKLQERYNTDRRRVYATGLSNGAQFSYRLACELSHRIAAIAPVGGQMLIQSCRPSRAVPVLNFHGTADNCSRYQGGECGGCIHTLLRELGFPIAGNGKFSCPPVPELFENWRDIDGCRGDAIETNSPDGVRCHSHKICREDSEVIFCSVEGMGHTWPGGRYGKPCRFNGRLCEKFKEIVGPLSTAISATDLMAEFFLRHHL